MSWLKTTGFYMALMVPSILTFGYVLSWLWEWFVVPLTELPPLTVWQSYGLYLIFTFMKGTTRRKEPIPTSEVWGLFAHGMTHAGLALGLGWIAYQMFIRGL